MKEQKIVLNRIPYFNSNSNLDNQNSKLSKDSVNTSYGEDPNIPMNNTKHSIKLKVNDYETRKTKIIEKQQPKNPLTLLKHKKVIQTLRNITKNIKNQISTKKDKTSQINGSPQANKNIHKQNVIKIFSKESSVNQVNNDRNAKLKYSQLKNPISSLMIQQSPNDNLKQNLQMQVKLSPCKSRYPISQVILYSKHKDAIQSFPVYEDRMLTDKKHFSNLAIQRFIDNDVQSDDQQIQLGINYMYCELLQSCRKNSSSKAKQAFRDSFMKSQKIQKDQDLSKVKQRLLFN